MNAKMITPIDSTAKSAEISKYSPDRQSRESGRRQQSPDSYKPKPEKKEADSIDKFFASAAKRPDCELSDFELLLKKVWEDNTRMQESAKAIEQAAPPPVNTWIWGISSNYRPIIKK